MKKLKYLVVLIILMLTFGIMMIGCTKTNVGAFFEKTDITIADKEKWSSDINTAKSSLAVSAKDVVGDKIECDEKMMENFNPTYYRAKANYAIEEIGMWGLNDNLFFPGALFNVSSDNQDEVIPVHIPDRKAITLSADVEGATGIVYSPQVVNEISLSNTNKAINNIVNDIMVKDANLPAKLSAEIFEVNSKEELDLQLGVGVNIGKKFAISNSFNFAKKDYATYAVLMIKQVFYTINVDFPVDGADGFFDENISKTKLRSYYGKKSIPVYCKSVSYGRMVAITIKTNRNMADIKNAFNTTLGIKGSTISNENEVISEIKNSNMELNYFIYGGASSASETIIGKTSIEEIINELKSDKDNSQNVGKPLSYQLHYIKDDTLAKLGSTQEYYYVKYGKKEPNKGEDGGDSSQIKQIFTYADLMTIIENPQGNYSLQKDIVIPEKSNLPIGSKDFSFCGKFDGNKHTITYKYVNKNDNKDDNVSLFRNINNATIENLNIVADIEVDKNSAVFSYCGGVAGQSKGSTIKNCGVTGNITFHSWFDSGEAATYVGGLVGKAKSTIIEGCFNKANIWGSNRAVMVGGLIGEGNLVNIKNCYNNGNITSDSRHVTGWSFVGGLLGRVFSTGAQDDNKTLIEYSYNSGVINALDGWWGSSRNIGAFVGDCNRREFIVSVCYFIKVNGNTGRYVGNVDNNFYNGNFIVERSQTKEIFKKFNKEIWAIDLNELIILKWEQN